MDQQLARGVQLHRTVPPHRWCLTKDQLCQFVSEVRVAWEAGRIADDPTHPDPRHDVPEHGPNMYRVNELFVKPLTFRAGGMSYALMLQPEGLPCEVFVSHAWAEGVFEFSEMIRRAWVGCTRNLYCCLLANPQNLDIGELLDVPASRSPFAAALRACTHIVAVPNESAPIYSRLWCVYEAYLAAKLEKVFVMPSKPKRYSRARACCVWAVLPKLFACAIGMALAVSPFSQSQERVAAHALTVLTMVNLTCLLVSGLWPWRRRKPFWLKMLDLGLYMAYSLVASDYLLASFLAYESSPAEMQSRDQVMSAVFRCSLVFGIVVLSWAAMARNVLCMLEMRSLQQMATELKFDSVRRATCSNPQDAARIWSELAGSEDDIDAVINILIRAGAYTSSLRKQYDAGIDITHAGFADVQLRTVYAMVLWLISTVVCVDRALSYGKDFDSWHLLWVVPALVCFCVTISIPVVLLRLFRLAPDWGVFASQVFSTTGVLVIWVPAAFMVDWVEKGHYLRPAELPVSGPTWVLVTVTAWPVVMALVSALVVYLGPTVVCLAWAPIHRCLCRSARSARGQQKRSGAEPESDGEFTGSGSDSDRDED